MGDQCARQRIHPRSRHETQLKKSVAIRRAPGGEYALPRVFLWYAPNQRKHVRAGRGDRPRKLRKRKKAPSKKFRDEFGHTPVSIEEKIPWKCHRLVIGTGVYGRLPVMQE